MLWEILPNARGPLIVDFCLRIGYTTILLGTLGFFGLGVRPKAPTGGPPSTGPPLADDLPARRPRPALALMSLVLGLNLLADGLREESAERLMFILPENSRGIFGVYCGGVKPPLLRRKKGARG